MGELLRRRAMMAASGGGEPIDCPYITDGLIFWLDGIDRGGVSGKWIDLIGGKTFTLRNVTELDNGVKFLSNGYGTHAGPVSDNWANETIEVATASMSYLNKCILCPSNSSPVGIGLITSSSGGYFMLNIDGVSKAKWSGLSTASRVSANNTNAVVNGSSKSKSSTDNWGANTTGTTYLGCRYTTAASRYMNGTLYSLRIYNRHLSVAEMQANQAVDVARFNL